MPITLLEFICIKVNTMHIKLVLKLCEVFINLDISKIGVFIPLITHLLTLTYACITSIIFTFKVSKPNSHSYKDEFSNNIEVTFLLHKPKQCIM